MARRLAREAEKRGFRPTVKDQNAVAPADLAKETRCVVITLNCRKQGDLTREANDSRFFVRERRAWVG